MRLAGDGEIQFRGSTLFKGYWHDDAATAAAFTEDGWYRTGDIGHFDPDGRLILSGRSKDMIVLPNGFNVYPRTSRTRCASPACAIRWWSRRDPAGSRQSCSPGPRHPREFPGPPMAATPRRSAARSTRWSRRPMPGLGSNQRVAAWRLWPDEDFPRTHTYKIKRAPIRAWAIADTGSPGT